MAKFRLGVGSGNGLHLGKARKALDHFLYSPGNRKELVIIGQKAAGSFDGGAVEILGLYSVLKARYLGKSLKVVVEGNIDGVEQSRLEFMREHGIYSGIHDAGI